MVPLLRYRTFAGTIVTHINFLFCFICSVLCFTFGYMTTASA